MDTPRELVALAVAAFLQKEATRRGCRVKDLTPMVEDAFNLALEGVRLGDELAHARDTLLDAAPAGVFFDEDDRITKPYSKPPYQE